MIGAYEAEEVGVEHLLRDVNDPTVSTLASQIKHKMTGLTALRSRLAEMKAYLEAVVAEKIPANNQILYNCQAIFNLMPNLNQDALVESMLVKTNDYHLAVYCASLVRCIIALHSRFNAFPALVGMVIRRCSFSAHSDAAWAFPGVPALF